MSSLISPELDVMWPEMCTLLADDVARWESAKI
jgi:hypothetical protein